EYGSDRVFAFLNVSGKEFETFSADLNAAGHPTISITLDSVDTLGQEFFRWEFATAVAGSIMKINPFNQPDVEAAKIEAKKITEEYEKTGSLPDEKPFFEEGGISLFSSEEYSDKLNGAAGALSLSRLLEAHLSQIAD